MPENRDRRPQYSFGVNPNPQVTLPSSRRKWKAVVAVAVAGLLVGGATYVYYNEPDYFQRVFANATLTLPATITHAYKWQGVDGAWHITGDPPAEGIVYEKLTVRSDTNILPATPTPEK